MVKQEVSKLVITYNLPGVKEKKFIELIKDSSENFARNLKDVEDFLASEKATNIVYRNINSNG